MSAISQEVTEALKTTSIASLLEYVIREIAMTDGEVVLEVVFSVGRFRRGYVRSGPISTAQLETHRHDTSSIRQVERAPADTRSPPEA